MSPRGRRGAGVTHGLPLVPQQQIAVQVQEQQGVIQDQVETIKELKAMITGGVECLRCCQ